MDLKLLLCSLLAWFCRESCVQPTFSGKLPDLPLCERGKKRTTETAEGFGFGSCYFGKVESLTAAVVSFIQNRPGCFFVSLSGPPCHICTGCCESRLESVDRAAALFQEVFLHAMTIPALNKWTTVAPSMTLVAAMQQCYDVIPQAFRRCFARGQAEESSDDSGGEDAALGVPRDQTKTMEEASQKEVTEGRLFLQDLESRFLTMLWGFVTFCVMTVHYSLFKRGTWLTERVEDETDTNLSFFFRNPAASPAARASSEIALLLDSVQVDAWIPLVGLYGPVLSWPQRRLRSTRRCLLTEVGQLYRKLLEPWKRYPWKLVELPLMEEPMRSQAAQDFFQVRDCCLDGFSAKLR